MPLPLAVQAIPYIGSGLLALKNLFGGGGGSSKNQGRDLQLLLQQIPELRQALQLQVRQAQRTDPLHAAIIQMSQRLLPRSAQGGGGFGAPPTAPADRSPQVVNRANRRFNNDDLQY